MNRALVSIFIVALLLSFAAGRYTAKTETVKTEEIKDVTSHVEEQKDTHTETKTVTIKQTDGTVTTTVIADTTVSDRKNRDTNIKDTVETSHNTYVTSAKKVTVSLLVSGRLHRSEPYVTDIPSCGISIQKQVLGAISIGVFGLTTGTFGASIGYSF